jgi:hypothetical protein
MRAQDKDYGIVMDVLPLEVGAIDGDGGTAGTWTRTWGPIRFATLVIEEV